MTYIRTKDKIFNTEELTRCEDKRFQNGWLTKKGVPLNAIKQSDTIEELCDAWIIIPLGVACNPFIRNINENIGLFINYSHIIYVAIWIKGNNGEPILQPVAKMNEKGDLCLI